MKQAQVTLKLVLDALGISPDISTINDRKRVQKAIYIGQKAGVDLGYSYGWYLLGPYSPELTQDYFTLNNDLSIGDISYEKFKLVQPLQAKLDKVKDLMTPPHNIPLSQEDWLELLASIIYLMSDSNLSRTKETISSEKPHLYEHFNVAYKSVADRGLVSH